MTETNGNGAIQRLAQGNPAGTPKTHLTSTQESHLLVFGLHIGTVGTVIDQNVVLIPAFDQSVLTRREPPFYSQICIAAGTQLDRCLVIYDKTLITPFQYQLRCFARIHVADCLTYRCQHLSVLSVIAKDR
jgi:hypothetical protein